MVRSRTSSALSRTSAAAPPTSTRAGRSLPPASSCFPASRIPTQHDGLVAAVYAPCEVHTVLRGTPVHVIEETNYPFQGAVRFTVDPASPLSFPLQLRIPAWAAGATIKVNGRTATKSCGRHLRADRTHMARRATASSSPFRCIRASPAGFNDSIAIERGPLVFSYGIGESWVKLRDRGMTADWQVFPSTAWNYALSVDAASPAKSITVTEAEVGPAPFSRHSAPVQLSVKARKLFRGAQKMASPTQCRKAQSSSDQPEETITLIPYAAAKLRITAFPHS